MAAEEYRRIVLTFWTDPDVKRPLTRDQKLLLLYFCTSPHSNMIGVYYCPLAYAANETDVPLDDVRKAIAGPLAAFLTYDEQTEEVFVHGLAKHNIAAELTLEGKNGKPDLRIAGVRKLIEKVHSARLIRAFLSRYGDTYHLSMPLPDSRQAPSEPLASPSEAKAVAVAVAVASQNNGAASPASRVEQETEPATTAGQVMATVRRVLWQPDGQPPPEWSEGREMSVIKALIERGETADDLIRAVHGITLLQGQGEVDWLRPGKVTLRVIYNSKNGSRDMLTQALDAYASGPPPPEKRKPGQRAQDAKRADFIHAAERFKRGVA